MVKKIVFSARQDHEVISHLINNLKQLEDFDFILHDPQKGPDDYLDRIDQRGAPLRNEV